MAKINSSILNGLSGKIGDLVFFIRNGKTFVKLLQKKRKIDSQKQQTHQEKFRMLLQFLNPLRPFIHQVNKEPVPGTTSFNRIFSQNLRTAIFGDYPDIAIDYSKLILSRGNLPNGIQVSCGSSCRGSLAITWRNNYGKAKAQDHAFAACYCEELNIWLSGTELALRKSRTCFFNMDAFQGRSVHVYFGFSSTIRALSSDSLYLGKVEVL